MKLAANAADLPDLKRALAAMTPGAALVRRTLVSTYFDTPELALRQAGSTLRVRDEDGRFTQTLKTADPEGANLLARGEWEDKVAGNRPDPTAPHSGSRLPVGVAGRLCPLFVTEITRETIEIEPSPGTRVEAAIDTGEIRAITGDPVAPVSEIEIELKVGDPAALYDLALKLLETAPLRIEPRSKSERGYRLIRSELHPAAVRAAAVALDPAMTVEAVMQTIGRACLAHLLRNEPAALDGQPEGVHQMRVAVRRLRSLLSAVKMLLPRDERRAVAEQLAGLATPLGPARNFDVLAAELLQPLRRRHQDEPGWDELSAAVKRARDEAHDRVKKEILSPRHAKTVLRLLFWFDGCGWRASEAPVLPMLTAPVGSVAADILDRRRRKVRRRSRHFARLSPKERHQLRIAVKKLRYTVELLRSLYPARAARRFVKALKPVQDALGHANDIRVAYGLVIELGKTAEPVDPIATAGGQLLALHERALLRGEPRLRKRLRRLSRAAPFWRG
ncbi:MAG: CHAD domain-containing protein [Stellaceae bacterium]